MPFIILMFVLFILVFVLVLSTTYLSCIGLFCMYVLANSRQCLFFFFFLCLVCILFSCDKLVLALLVISKDL